jgi:hypothetical protein
MEFMQVEAKEKERKRQWVRTRDNAFLAEYGIPAGMHGQIVYAHPLGRGGGAPAEAVWVVNVCFYPGHVLVAHIGKGRYEASLLECDVHGR